MVTTLVARPAALVQSIAPAQMQTISPEARQIPLDEYLDKYADRCLARLRTICAKRFPEAPLNILTERSESKIVSSQSVRQGAIGIALFVTVEGLLKIGFSDPREQNSLCPSEILVEERAELIGLLDKPSSEWDLSRRLPRYLLRNYRWILYLCTRP